MKNLNRTVLLTVTAALILTITSCSKQSVFDINGFVKEMNENSQDEICAEDFTVVRSDRTEYSYMYDNHTLLTLYADDDGSIVQCTVTSDSAADEVFIVRCALAGKILMNCSNDEAKKLCEAAKKSRSVEYGAYKIIFNDYTVGRTMIINRSDDEINTNSMPTLKRTVKAEDISRPTAAESADKEVK
ncbi:MAG: hypothetical protein PUB20_07400 [Clostridia bacterium]|nr:hypothetical protein [Clostridia bacterium]